MTFKQHCFFSNQDHNEEAVLLRCLVVEFIKGYGSYHTEYMSSYYTGIYGSYYRGICEYLSYGDMGSYNTIHIPLL